MSVVEPGNCWDANPNGIPGDEDYVNILNILDFPMESLASDDAFVDDWDITNSKCLGPIPSAVLMAPPTNPNVKVESGLTNLSSEVIAPTAGASLEQKVLSDVVKGASDPPMILPKKSEAQESSIFQNQSPVSVLESSGSCSAGKNLPNPSPVRIRSKRVKRQNSWISATSYFTSTPRKDKNMKRKLAGPRTNEIKNPSQVLNCPAVNKKCTHCEVTKTPQWREGPLGPKTLCNACGVRFRSGRLFPEYRPAASPTFVPALHSNSHRKVVEMRTKGKGSMTEIGEGPASPQPEFVPMSNYLFDYID